jgi:hypothetical protein
MLAPFITYNQAQFNNLILSLTTYGKMSFGLFYQRFFFLRRLKRSTLKLEISRNEYPR